MSASYDRYTIYMAMSLQADPVALAEALAKKCGGSYRRANKVLKGLGHVVS